MENRKPTQTQICDYVVLSSPEAELEAEEADLNDDKSSLSDIVDEMLEDPALKEMEETLLATIQVLEDTLQETQILNELETRELKQNESRLQQKLQEQTELNEQTMQLLQEERQKSDQLAASKAQKIDVESFSLDPSTLPEGELMVTSNDLTKLLQIQEERHAQEMKELEQKLKKEEDKRAETERDNVRLEAAATVAKSIAEDTKQEDSVLQQQLKERQEMLELANRKLKKLDSELITSKQALKDQSTDAKAEQAAVKANEQELQKKIRKLEADMKTLTVKDAKAQATISNLEDIQTELEETLKNAKHERATSKAAAVSAQKSLKQTKALLAESMAKVGRLETRLAKSQMQSQSRKPNPPPKKDTAQAKRQPPKASQPASTAQKVPRLDNWELTDEGEVQGSVFDHPSLPNGEPIRTSALVNPKQARDGGTVKTSSGSLYRLGKKKRQAPSASTSTPSSTKQTVVAVVKPEPKAKQQAPSSPPAKKQAASPAVNLFSSFQKKPKETLKKEEPKPAIEEPPKAVTKSSPSISSIFGIPNTNAKETKAPEANVETKDPKPDVQDPPKVATKASPSISSIFGIPSTNAKDTKEAEADAETKDPKSAVEEPPKTATKASPSITSIFGIPNTHTKDTKEAEATADAKDTKEAEATAETKDLKSTDEAGSKPPPTSMLLPRMNFFGNAAAEKSEEETKKADKAEDENIKSKPYTSFNIFGSKPTASKDKLASEQQEKSTPEPVAAPSTSAYGRRKKIQKNEKAVEESSEELTLTGRTMCNGKYLLAGKPKKSVTGRCLILGAYHADANSKPTGNPIVIKLSENTDAMKKEHSIYQRVSSAVNKGVVVKCHSFIPEVEDRPGKSALILERGARDLKEHRRWIGMEGDDLKEALFSVAQCLDSIHGARMVWTDLKTENFVVVEDDDGHKVKAIDLESAMNVNNHPKDFTPEASPPEFAREYVYGDPHSFVLNYSFDVWSFGMLAYELAAGVGYYDGNSPDAIMQKLSQKKVPNPSIGIKDDDLADLIAQCLALDPKQRPSAQRITRHPYFASVAKPALFQFIW